MFPLAKYYFEVSAGDDPIKFTEVSGLERELQPIEYRYGSDPNFNMTKIPGIEKYSNVTLKRGMFEGDNKLWGWIQTFNLNKVEKRDITISLLNEKGSPVFTWELFDAWPTKLKVSDLKSDASELCIEEVEFCIASFTQRLSN